MIVVATLLDKLFPWFIDFVLHVTGRNSARNRLVLGRTISFDFESIRVQFEKVTTSFCLSFFFRIINASFFFDKTSNHYRVAPNATHNNSKDVVSRLAAGSVDALFEIGNGFESYESAILHAAYQQGTFENTSMSTPLGLYEAMSPVRVPPVDRRTQPDAVDTCGFAPKVYEAIRRKPVDIVSEKGTFGIGQPAALTARAFREQLLTACCTMATLTSMLRIDPITGPNAMYAGIDPGQSALASGVVAFFAIIDESGKIIDPLPAATAKLKSLGHDVDNQTAPFDRTHLEAAIDELTLIYQHHSVDGIAFVFFRCFSLHESHLFHHSNIFKQGKTLWTNASVGRVSIGGAAAAAARAYTVDSMTHGVGGRTADADCFNAYHNHCRTSDSFVPLASDDAQRSLDGDRDVGPSSSSLFILRFFDTDVCVLSV